MAVKGSFGRAEGWGDFFFFILCSAVCIRGELVRARLAVSYYCLSENHPHENNNFQQW